MMAGPSSGRLTPNSGHSQSRAGSTSQVMIRPTVNPTSVKVVVRIRPPTTEHARVSTRFQRTVVAALNSSTLQLESATSGGSASLSASSALTKTPKLTFTFDRVISPEEGQSDVFACAEPLVESFLTGLNATILAYGQTSSGKSYTMGTDRTSEADDALGEDRLGITPRAVALIFDRMREITKATRGATAFNVKLSYVEIYNEDLIDLLAGNADVRPTVQIREDKQGNIFWSGLREVKVTSALEVMTHLTEGSALRQTGATDMNAQSSRSHAIFSLTLTQRVSVDGGPVDGSSASPSRASPRSPYSPRVSSPGPGATSRSATPIQDRPGSRFGLRPPSIIGTARPVGDPFCDSSHGPSTSAKIVEVVQCTTITSKFHFVDLAGSERLKRTAAAGDRVKEGISINAGLLALGNVISALGDPSKKSTHVPYRDSKLTRLLQDSLGGNAHTMMIACVSPTELNLNESLSTVKYANRARNIKNRAEVNQIEAGWDDVEYLQRTLIKLRAELALLKSGAPPPTVDAGDRAPRISDGQDSATSLSPDIHELRGKFTNLSRGYTQLLSEQVQLSSTNSESGLPAPSMQDEFCRVVDPIIEEYERSLSAIESQLALTRAALSHSEDEMRELETRVEAEIATNESNAKSMENLKARIARLCERESTTEAYVRDLECKLKDFGDHDASRGSAVTDLRKEITRHREHGATQELYIKDLEVRLAKAEETEVIMRSRIDTFERDIQRHEEAYRELESRLSLLNTAEDQKILLAELDGKNLRVIELERSVDELKRENLAAETEVERLVTLAAVETESRAELQSQVQSLERAAAVSTSDRKYVLREPLPAPPVSDSASDAALGTVSQGKHGSASTGLTGSPRGVLVPLSQNGEDSLSRGKGLALSGDGREEFAPSPTFQSRSSSSSPNQNRGPRARRSMPLSPQHRLSFLGRGQGPHQPTATHSRSASFSCPEQSSPISSQASLPPKAHSPSPYDGRSPSAASRDNLFGVSFSPTHGNLSIFTSERTYEQMEAVIMKLQQALTEREHEMTAQEASLLRLRGELSETSNPTQHDAARLGDTVSNSSHNILGRSGLPSEGLSMNDDKPADTSDTAAERLEHLMRSMAQKESLHRAIVDQLQDRLATLQRQFDELTVLSRDQVTNMSHEIGRLRAQVIANASSVSDSQDEYDSGGLKVDVIEEQRICNLDDHRVYSGTQQAPHHSELVEVGSSLHSGHFEESHNFCDEDDNEIGHVETDLASSEKTLGLELAEATYGLSTIAEQDQTRISDTIHQSRVLGLWPSASPQDGHLEQGATRSTELEQPLPDDLEAVHSLEPKQREAEHVDALARLKSTYEDALVESDRAHADVLARLDRQRAEELGEAARLHSSITTALDNEDEARAARMEEEHAASLQALGQSHEALLDASREADCMRLTQLSLRHESALSSKDEAHQTAIRMSEAEQMRAIDNINKSHTQELNSLSNSLLSSHSEDLRKTNVAHLESVALLQEHQNDTTALQTAHKQVVCSMIIKHEQALELLRTESEKAIASLRAEYDHESAIMRATFEQEVASLRLNNEQTVFSVRADHEKQARLLQVGHDREIASSRVMHEQELAQKASEFAAICESMRTTNIAKIDLVEKERNEAQSKYLELGTSYARLQDKLVDAQNALATMQHNNRSSSALNQELVDVRLLADRLTVEADTLRQERGLRSSQSTGPATSSVGPQSKPVPPSQPPTVPPPSLPTSTQARNRSSSTSSQGNASSSPRESMTSATARPSSSTTIDSSLVRKVDDLEAQVSKLVKQLTHCEGDLQANIDLVNTLESALSDSERNLRKARVQMNDLAKERDNYLSQNEAIRRELQDSHNETENVRHSVMEVESQLQAERYNRDRAKQELERRLEDVNRKGKNKFACF
ncbi:BQ2448_2309 [Microbotryum intermedium]|uniref:BQ2448_2309 protein n=1 Tax=Microbotryum intermedium TaxID=269621 RepID=A0A238F950_9BASI|nr:BQ2448_2309 [Microbotryum intermedium]